MRSHRTPASETAFHCIRVLLDGSLRSKREKVPGLAVLLDANSSDCLTESDWKNRPPSPHYYELSMRSYSNLSRLNLDETKRWPFSRAIETGPIFDSRPFARPEHVFSPVAGC